MLFPVTMPARFAVLLVFLFVAPLGAIEPLPVRYSLDGPSQDRWNETHEMVEGAQLYYIYAPDSAGGLMHETHFIYVGGVDYDVYEPRWVVALFRGRKTELHIQCTFGSIEHEYIYKPGVSSLGEIDLEGRKKRIEISDDTADLLVEVWRRAMLHGYEARRSRTLSSIVGMRGVFRDGDFLAPPEDMEFLETELVGCYDKPPSYSIGSEVEAIGSQLFACLLTDDEAIRTEKLAKVEEIAQRALRWSDEERAEFVKRGQEIDAILQELEGRTPRASASGLDPFAKPEPPPPPPPPALLKKQARQALAELTALYAEYYEISETEAREMATSGITGRILQNVLGEELDARPTTEGD